MAGRRGGDIAGEIRGAFIRAVKAREPENRHHNNTTTKTLTEIIDHELETNPLGLLNAIKGFVPKELFASVEEKSHEEWIDELEEMAKDEDDE